MPADAERTADLAPAGAVEAQTRDGRPDALVVSEYDAPRDLTLDDQLGKLPQRRGDDGRRIDRPGAEGARRDRRRGHPWIRRAWVRRAIDALPCTPATRCLAHVGPLPVRERSTSRGGARDAGAPGEAPFNRGADRHPTRDGSREITVHGVRPATISPRSHQDRSADPREATGPSADGTWIGPNARASYGRYLRHHIGPLLGASAVTAVGYREVAGFVRGLLAKGLSPKTIANIHGLLSASMTTAVKLGYRPDNPCVGVSLPKSQLTHDEMTVLTRDEFALLLSKVAPFYQPLVLTLVATGMRFGEATALTASDVDVSARPATIRVTKAWKRDEDSRYYVGPPKTKRARRTISLPDELVDVLLPLLATKAPDELLFPNTVGQWLSSSRFWTSTWTPALDAACRPVRPDGTPDPDAPRLTKRPRVHDLRHTHASWMLAAGTDLFVLQRRLGHESITTTTETYAHLMPDQQNAAVEAAAEALRGLTIGSRRSSQ